MDANCKVWSSELNRFLSVEFCMIDDGEIYVNLLQGIDSDDNRIYRWVPMHSDLPKELGLSFYPG